MPDLAGRSSYEALARLIAGIWCYFIPFQHQKEKVNFPLGKRVADKPIAGER